MSTIESCKNCLLTVCVRRAARYSDWTLVSRRLTPHEIEHLRRFHPKRHHEYLEHVAMLRKFELRESIAKLEVQSVTMMLQNMRIKKVLEPNLDVVAYLAERV